MKPFLNPKATTSKHSLPVHQIHSHNPPFAAWLALGSSVQVLYLFLWLAKWEPTWTLHVDTWFCRASWALTVWALYTAFMRWNEAKHVNPVVFWGLLASIVLHFIVKATGTKGEIMWLVSNLAGLAPSLYMFLAFAGLRMDMLPLWLREDQPWTVAARMCGAAVSSLIN